MLIRKQDRIIRTIDDWFALAPPLKGADQWVEGRSAYECARAWCGNGAGPVCPGQLCDLLSSHQDTTSAVVTEAFPEHLVRFDTLGEPRHSDVCAIAEHPLGTIAISIEAKADETFDRLVADVLKTAIAKIAEDKGTNAVTRVQQLAAALLPDQTGNEPSLGALRYQLLTGLAGAIAFAAEVRAARAAFIIHEFVTDRTRDEKHRANSADLDRFLCRLTAGKVGKITSGSLIGPVSLPGTPLFHEPAAVYIGKISTNLRRPAGATVLTHH